MPTGILEPDTGRSGRLAWPETWGLQVGNIRGGRAGLSSQDLGGQPGHSSGWLLGLRIPCSGFQRGPGGGRQEGPGSCSGGSCRLGRRAASSTQASPMVCPAAFIKHLLCARPGPGAFRSYFHHPLPYSLLKRTAAVPISQTQVAGVRACLPLRSHPPAQSLGEPQAGPTRASDTDPHG